MTTPRHSSNKPSPTATDAASRAVYADGPLPYGELPTSYHRWKWQVLVAFCVFYFFVYTGRFNFWPTSPLIKEDLLLTHIEIGVINAMLLWGFMLGDLVHGRLAEAYGLRLWVMLGAILTTVFNWVASFGTSTIGIAIPWAIVGFVNAACWAPAISIISQWWPRRERGIAMGIVGTTTGGAMLMMWWLSSFVAAEWGWRAAFRYPPLIILVLGIAFYFMARDRPADVNLPEYIEDDAVSSEPESVSDAELKGLGPYRVLLGNSRFQLACHVKGLENVARYGLTTWVPIYYFEAGGLDITQTILITLLLPLGYLLAPPVSGFISDRLLGSRRRPLVIASCILSAAALVAIALAPPSNMYLGAALMLWGGIGMGVSTISAIAVDLSGRRMSGTAAGVLDAHGYLYAGAQALLFSVVLDVAGSPWPLVFLAMAATRIISAVMISRVRV